MPTNRVKVTRVIDGDTVDVLVDGGAFRRARQKRIRLYGIDAPESSQRGGPESTKHLKRLIGRRNNMWMEDHGQDQYGRTIGNLCRRKGGARDSYNYMMVRDGHARVYMAKAADKGRYEAAEKEAQRSRKGLWRDKNPQAPWEYRRQEKAREEAKGGGGKWVVLIFAAILIAVVILALVSGVELPITMPEPPGLPSLPDLPQLPPPLDDFL